MPPAAAKQVDWQVCPRCTKRCKGARRLGAHKKWCDRKEALRLQQLQRQGANGARHQHPPHAIPTAADWAWAAEVDLEEELLPDFGARQVRIPQAAHGDLARALLLPLKRIVADHTDEGAWAILFLFPILVLGALVRGGSAGLRNLKDRCRRFESGDWEGLLDDHHEADELLAAQFELRDLQVALALLTRVFVQRPSYLMRTVAPSPEFQEQLRGFDGLVFGCLESLLGPDAFAGNWESWRAGR
jgi:hypothetical protein